MQIIKRQGLAISFVAALFMASCGGSSNFNKMIFVDRDDSERFDVVMTNARLAYDDGHYFEAQRMAEKAYDLSPHSEKTAQLLGFVYLARAGIDIFSLIKKMNELGSKKATANSGSLDVLGDLSSLIELKTSDLALLGSYHDSTNTFFEGLPVYVPFTPGDHSDRTSPRATVAPLAFVNKAIRAICPFIDPSLTANFKHERYTCEATSGTITAAAQSYFLFAMAHLVETLAFHAVLLYNGTGEEAIAFRLADAHQANSNLLKRASALQGRQVGLSEMGNYAGAVVELKEVIEGVFDAQEGAMLYETLGDLRMVVGALGMIKGIPASVSKNLEDALATIEKSAEQAGKASEGLGGQSEALRQQLNEKIVTEVNANINKYLDKFDAAELNAEQLENAKQMCTAADALVKDAARIPPPAKCREFALHAGQL